MGMGYAGSSALTLSDEQVKKAVGDDLYKKFTDALEACPLGESELFMYDFDIDDHDLSDEDRALVEACMEAYDEVMSAFKKATKIDITRNYHDTENDGDRYDTLSPKERNRIHYMAPSKNRGHLRSKTYEGIAKAMAEQYTAFALSGLTIDEFNQLSLSRKKLYIM